MNGNNSDSEEGGGSSILLSEHLLSQPPDDVFEILSKLGKGSYGSVYKARVKQEGRQTVAIKKVPVDTDLQDIVKEISIMQQCDCTYIVRFFGSYLKDTDLWIVMEYCGAGSIIDIMRLRSKTLNELEIGAVLGCVLRGLEYLHKGRKIHRDIKAGNILLTSHGQAKLADFGVAGQLTDTMAKRNTVIGTPFWMAPEVIQEVGYECSADIWSLGITTIEMADGKPPYGDIHPMRALFMIPSKPPPSFRNPSRWSSEMLDLVSRCLVKQPLERSTATQLLQCNFMRSAASGAVLREMIYEAQELRKAVIAASADSGQRCTYDVSLPASGATADATLVLSAPSALDTARHSGASSASGTYVSESEQNTMVINPTASDRGDVDDELDGTMRIAADEEHADYRPTFLDHFADRDAAAVVEPDPVAAPVAVVAPAALKRAPEVAAADAVSNCDLLDALSASQLNQRLSGLDADMERELEALQIRYSHKRRPIQEAINMKKLRQLNF